MKKEKKKKKSYEEMMEEREKLGTHNTHVAAVVVAVAAAATVRIVRDVRKWHINNKRTNERTNDRTEQFAWEGKCSARSVLIIYYILFIRSEYFFFIYISFSSLLFICVSLLPREFFT